ncbi:putative tetratricopeptide-like helical domain superfamily, DYW domain-containing protein [Helianthus annuus]|nr:putative tetratricopeptide-like helical domain superfamily, DYW domain-containing protein [Helianthus annuus]KAJ0627358.1 putative tetratricopeptide-like helical domain superfamily, DYW domain-containing protein [Helianthus annuus]KAJ0783662.1 putative tetratricopeptide-like helical domain superfamily, DYW domain-containing protein [Helianthus annuus]
MVNYKCQNLSFLCSTTMPSSNIHQSLYSTLSKSLSSTSTIKQLHKIHSLLITSGLHQTPFFSGKLITKYSHFKHPHSSSLIFTTISPTTNVYQWNTIIRAMTHNGLFTEALDYYYSMRVSNIKPDKFTFPSVINACASCSGKIETAKIVHEHVLEMGFGSDLYIGNALVDMYARFGELRVARQVFDEMPERDVVSWNSLVSGYSANEEWEEALDVFYQSIVVGVRVDSLMVSSVLAACGGSGGFSEGQMVHGLTVKVGIDVETRVCNGLLSMYFKSNNLKESEKFILSMPIKPDASIWGSLLSACRASGHKEIAERASKHIIKLNSENTGYYILVSNAYASLGKWDQVRTVRKSIKSKGLKKDAGKSWIDIDNKIYAFSSGDKFFEQYEEVKNLLEVLYDLIAKEGYVANLRSVFHDVNEDEKRDILCGHSERLAIAFGLLNTKAGMPLQIMKNLRVCEDCHTVTKYISKIVQREFLVRDANRFHLFKNGSCSCGDYW